MPPLDSIPKKRTEQQNRALYLAYTRLADALNDAGLEVKKVLKPSYNVWWTKQLVHDHLWIPIQQAMYGTNSTTKLEKHEQIEKIYDLIMRELGEKFGLEYIPFPHETEISPLKTDEY